MGSIPLLGDDVRMLMMIVGLFALGISGAILHSRHEWRALRHLISRPIEGQKTLSRPGRLSERIGAAGWESTFRDTLLRSRHSLQDTGHSAAADAVEAAVQNAEKLAPLVQELALAALTEGELRSGLVRFEGLLIYVLVFPGRHDDPRAFRGNESLAHRWPVHARAVLGTADRDRSKTVPMLSLLWFLGLDARSGTLLVAYDGDEKSLYPVELADPADRLIPAAGVAGLSQDFVLS